MLEEGGGKGANHYYYGVPSSGKTALTLPLIEVFKDYVMLKPQVGTTFALSNLLGKQMCIWQDFRWPHPPLAWTDLLNVLDNEGFNVAVPKTDGDRDVPWNSEGKEPVCCVFTSNRRIAYCTSDGVDDIETEAFYERFGAIYEFRHRLPTKDKKFKKHFRCAHCYARWLLSPDLEVFDMASQVSAPTQASQVTGPSQPSTPAMSSHEPWTPPEEQTYAVPPMSSQPSATTPFNRPGTPPATPTHRPAPTSDRTRSPHEKLWFL